MFFLPTGVSTSVPYDPSIHDKKYAMHRRIEGYFKPLIRKGTRVIPGESSAQEVFNSQYAGSACVDIYKTDLDKPPTYDYNCERVASLHIKLRNKK